MQSGGTYRLCHAPHLRPLRYPGLHHGFTMKRFSLACFTLAGLLLTATGIHAQTISPIITEYSQKGEGRIELTNDTLTPLIVFLQPQSFSLAPDGTAVYRPLDPGIHVDLSTTSVRLLPRQQYFVFYKTHADSLPAWYTIYATFSPAQRGPGLNVRVILPHTVYLLQKQPLRKEDIQIGQAQYDPAKKLILCDLQNISKAYGRMREGSIQAGRESAPVGGFPLLPGSPRHLQIAWTGKNPPALLILHFDRFDLRLPVHEAPPPGLSSGS